VFGFQGHMLGD